MPTPSASRSNLRTPSHFPESPWQPLPPSNGRADLMGCLWVHQIISLKKPYAPKNTCTRHTLTPLPLLCRKSSILSQQLRQESDYFLGISPKSMYLCISYLIHIAFGFSYLVSDFLFHIELICLLERERGLQGCKPRSRSNKQINSV